jgi:hypothetical protein
VIAVGNIFDISACVMPPIRNDEPGILTSDVKHITRILVIKRIKCIREKNIT